MNGQVHSKADILWPEQTHPLSVAGRKTIRIWAEQSLFELKDELKRRGYRWSDGADGLPRSRYIDVDQYKQRSETAFLRKVIYVRYVEPRVQAMSAMSAMNRFSVRV
jgi:DNA polymerase-3 subunit epsilon